MSPSSFPQKVIVRATARLHLGFIDLHGGLGRVFGSLGVALQEPRNVIEVKRMKNEIKISSEREAVIRRYVDVFTEYFQYSAGLEVTDWEAIPRHVGLGSGTQLALAVGAGIATLGGNQVDAFELARVASRGRVSGIGSAVFAHGGFVIDGGKQRNSSESGKDVSGEIPPLIVRHPVPEDWIFVVAIPNVVRGLSGADEAKAFANLPPAAPSHAHTISRMVLMKMLPALIEHDIEQFGQALSAIQVLVGDAFAPAQGGRFSSPEVAQCITAMLEAGAYGAGQSSWGPTCFGLAQGKARIEAIKKAVSAVLDMKTGGDLFTTSVNNEGVNITVA